MKESENNPMQEKSWRKLTAAEEADLRAWLASHPESRADWELERRLTKALDRLPNVPVPSNFTARVLQAVEREGVVTARPRKDWANWIFRSLVPRVAVAAAILGAGLLTYHQRTVAKRAELVQGVKVVAGVSSLPSPEILQDFDTIRQLGSSPGPDAELIALMK